MFYRATTFLLLAAGLLIFAGQASALEQGDKLIRFGVATVQPNDDSDPDIVSVEAGTQAFINGVYMLRKNIGVELLASLPFKHDIELKSDGSQVGEVQHLPPTLSLQYYFTPDSNIRPYVGAGLNYTLFFSEDTSGALAGTDLSLDNSFGLAAQLGVDVDINDKWFVNADVRYINIETTADTAVGEIDVDINPWVFSLGVGLSF